MEENKTKVKTGSRLHTRCSRVNHVYRWKRAFCSSLISNHWVLFKTLPKKNGSDIIKAVMETINTAALLCATSSKSSKNETWHCTGVNIMLQKESALLLCITMNLMYEWAIYFNINLYVSSYTYSTWQQKLHLKHLHFVYFSSYTFVCPSDFASSLFSPPQPCNGRFLRLIVLYLSLCTYRGHVSSTQQCCCARSIPKCLLTE